MTDWKPIETAPKDGTRIILLVNNYAIEAHYNSERYYESKLDVVTLLVCGCGCCSYENNGRFPIPLYHRR
jgi:hypothetical protein